MTMNTGREEALIPSGTTVSAAEVAEAWTILRLAESLLQRVALKAGSTLIQPTTTALNVEPTHESDPSEIRDLIL